MDAGMMKSQNVLSKVWVSFQKAHPAIAEFLVFFIVCNGVTVLQMILMPMLKEMLGHLWKSTSRCFGPGQI